ncbi:rifamycin-inactivating phosphotransferase [Nocardiopsis coralliicola]
MRYVQELAGIDASMAAGAGGKVANLGEVRRIGGIWVPDGFCVTTAAYRQMLAGAPAVAAQIGRLERMDAADRAAVAALSTGIRRGIEDAPVPAGLSAEIGRALARYGADGAYAVRSSATAEDLPAASSAGQQDSYLGISGTDAVLAHVRRCWASLFTERAVAYRLRAGAGGAEMAVLVQQMVEPDAAGTMFTADPVTSNRTVAVVEAVPGLGEDLVAGRVSGEVFRVRGGRAATEAAPRSGAAQPVLTESQAVRLVRLGRRIEAHFGRPQDIEWCRSGEDFAIVQSRPVTTLFPLPGDDGAGAEDGDGGLRVYLSAGHQQMMTDAMRPLGLSLWQMTTPRPMREAGGRLFSDATPLLADPAQRTPFLDMLAASDPRTVDALRSLLDRGALPDRPAPGSGTPPAAVHGGPAGPVEADPGLAAGLVARAEESAAALRAEIGRHTGSDLLGFIRSDIATELKRVLFDPAGIEAIMAAQAAGQWLNEHVESWLGIRNAADALTQSAPDNVTAQMGLALLDVADAIRPHPGATAFLQRAADPVQSGGASWEELLAGLAQEEGGPQAAEAIRGYLDAYGMRCAGEIDITRTRWSEDPALLLPALLANVAGFAPGESTRRFEQGLERARSAEQDIIGRLRALPGGAEKAAQAEKRIGIVRTYAGYREYPKYGMVVRYFLYRQALLGEADRLVGRGTLQARDDIYYLRFEELAEAVRTGSADAGLIRERREAFASHAGLTPPRVLTSEGEALDGQHGGSVPQGALAGLAVSSGTVEGRACVATDMARARLEAGDILVTAYTDPSWTPLFVSAGGLVTEVGGLMTHGAVIAREYGLPAVVGVDGATRAIRDGQRIRVNGTDGYVEILD